MSWIEFDKERYHQQGEMIEWCKKNIGPGSWSYHRDVGDGDMWGILSMFGRTSFMFRYDEDAVAFRLVWA